MIGPSDVASLEMPNNTLIRAAWGHGGPSKFLAHRHSAHLHSKGARGSKARIFTIIWNMNFLKLPIHPPYLQYS